MTVRCNFILPYVFLLYLNCFLITKHVVKLRSLDVKYIRLIKYYPTTSCLDSRTTKRPKTFEAKSCLNGPTDDLRPDIVPSRYYRRGEGSCVLTKDLHHEIR